MNAGKVNLGIILIIIGVASLAVNTDAMHWTVYFDLLEFWPVLLIAIGLQMVFKRFYAPLAYTSCLLLAVFGFYILYANYSVYSGDDGDRLSSLPMSRLDSDIERLSVEIRADDAELSVSSSSSNLVRCYYDEPFARPVISYSTSGKTATIAIDDRGLSGLHFFEYEAQPDWSMKLHNGLPMTLDVDCADSDVRLRLEDFMVEEFVSDTRYSNVDARFGSLVRDMKATMRVNRSEVRIKLPDSAGVEILDPDNFDEFYVGQVDFIKDGDRLVTADFDSAAVRFSFDFEGEAKILSIRYY